MQVIDKLIEQSISWIKHPNSLRYYYIILDRGIVLLRLNDFPDEPLLTLIHGLEILDIEEVPQKWIVPFGD